MRYRVCKLLSIAVVVISLCSCDQDGSPDTATSSPSTTFNSVSRITYQYVGTLGLVGVPSSATAYSGDDVAAKAVAKFDGDLAPGSLKTLEVEETHYDIAGNVVYRGRILFQAQFDGYIVEEETALEGKRPLQAFSTWPLSH